MAIEVHCDEGNILTNGGSRAQIRIFGESREKVNVGNKEKNYLGGIPIYRPIWGSLRVETSRYAGKIQDVCRGSDAARFLKSTSAELYGNGNVDI